MDLFLFFTFHPRCLLPPQRSSLSTVSAAPTLQTWSEILLHITCLPLYQFLHLFRARFFGLCQKFNDAWMPLLWSFFFTLLCFSHKKYLKAVLWDQSISALLLRIFFSFRLCDLSFHIETFSATILVWFLYFLCNNPQLQLAHLLQVPLIYVALTCLLVP